MARRAFVFCPVNRANRAGRVLRLVIGVDCHCLGCQAWKVDSSHRISHNCNKISLPEAHHPTVRFANGPQPRSCMLVSLLLAFRVLLLKAQPPLTAFPLAHAAMQLFALKFADSQIVWNVLHKPGA